MPCPDPGVLAEFAAGVSDPSGREAVRRHLADCALCCATLARAEPFRESGDVDRHVPVRWTVVRKRLVPAAAGILLAFLTVAIWNVFGRPAASGKLAVPSGEIVTAPGQGRRMGLSDGTLLDLQGGSHARFLPLQSGDRCRLELRRGAMTADIGKGKGLFRIHCPGGEVEVLGTRFQVRVFDLKPDQETVFHAFCVDVEEGAVQIRNRSGSTVIRSAQRGIAVDGIEPFQQAQGGSESAFLEGFSRLLEPPDPRGRLRPGVEKEALSLAASYWGTFGWGRERRSEGDSLSMRLLDRWRWGEEAR